MLYFDCNCFFGTYGAVMYECPDTPDALSRKLKYCGIEKALVYCIGQRFGAPQDWNDRLPAMLAGCDNLFPTYTLLPPQTEGPDERQILPLLRKNGYRAVWLFQTEHRYLLNRLTFGKTLDALSEARVPVFVKARLPEIGELLKDYPNLRVVAVNQGPHSVERYLRPLMEHYGELRIELSHYLIQDALEEGVRLYGAHRFLFGSGYPGNPAGGAQLMVACAKLTDSQREQIAGKNLETLLEEAVIC